MSTKKITNSNITERLLLLVNERTGGNAAEFAKKAGIKQVTFHNFTKGRMPNTEALNNICDTYNVNLNWLVAGKGEKYIRDEGKRAAVDDDPEVAELLEGARRVLKSGNPVAFDALERNIRYFDHAVATEKRLETLEERMEALMEILRRKDKVSPAAQEPGKESTKRKVI